MIEVVFGIFLCSFTCSHISKCQFQCFRLWCYLQMNDCIGAKWFPKHCHSHDKVYMYISQVPNSAKSLVGSDQFIWSVSIITRHFYHFLLNFGKYLWKTLTWLSSSFPGISQQHSTEQMERRAMPQSHLLGYSMIHMAIDDGYSILSLSLASSTLIHIHTHT